MSTDRFFLKCNNFTLIYVGLEKFGLKVIRPLGTSDFDQTRLLGAFSPFIHNYISFLGSRRNLL
jgi:hypothetical protein